MKQKTQRTWLVSPAFTVAKHGCPHHMPLRVCTWTAKILCAAVGLETVTYTTFLSTPIGSNATDCILRLLCAGPTLISGAHHPLEGVRTRVVPKQHNNITVFSILVNLPAPFPSPQSSYQRLVMSDAALERCSLFECEQPCLIKPAHRTKVHRRRVSGMRKDPAVVKNPKSLCSCIAP